MTELLTAAQMRAIEAAAIASGEVTGLELMERAGRGVVEAIFEEWPGLRATSHRAVVLCGPGGNGGDGFVVARLLKEWGWEVEVFLYGDPERLPPDARVNYERWVGMGEVCPLTMRSGADVTLFIDALFGTGLTRELPITTIEFADHLFETRGVTFFVSIDILSGLCADSGRVIGERALLPYAELTVSFHTPKVGHYLAAGVRDSGELEVTSIGLKAGLRDHPDRGVILANPPKSRLRKSSAKHKYSHGHALILSGPSGRGGAARLSARGALRFGAGVVTVGCPLDAIPENAARLDAVMLRGVGDGEALAGLLEDQRINALCLGPGMGVGAREAGLLAVALGLPNPVPGLTRDLSSYGGDPGQGGPGSSPGRGWETAGSPPPPTPPHEGEGRLSGPGTVPNESELALPLAGRGKERLLGPGSAPDESELPLPLVGRGEGRGASSGNRRPLVLDADALTILSQHPDLFAALHPKCVLTPHAGEFARLFPDIAEKLAEPATKGPAYSKVDATREAAQRAGCVVLYKGPDTVIADPLGRCAINSAHYDRAAPWLATAGSGDVLAGFITGLLARGFRPFDAACTGAWLHVECALSFGPGLIAEDLPEELPKVFRALGL